MEFVILGSNVKEGCFSIKVDYMKLIGLAMKQYELGCFIHRDERELEAAATSSSLSTKYEHEDNHYIQDIASALISDMFCYWISTNIIVPNCNWKIIVIHLQHHYLLYARCFIFQRQTMKYYVCNC